MAQQYNNINITSRLALTENVLPQVSQEEPTDFQLEGIWLCLKAMWLRKDFGLNSLPQNIQGTISSVWFSSCRSNSLLNTHLNVQPPFWNVHYIIDYPMLLQVIIDMGQCNTIGYNMRYNKYDTIWYDRIF